jgi:hypothetical protein
VRTMLRTAVASLNIGSPWLARRQRQHRGHTALVIPVPEAEPAVSAIRRQYDAAANSGMPAHITLVYPFVPIDAIADEVEDAIRSILLRDGCDVPERPLPRASSGAALRRPHTRIRGTLARLAVVRRQVPRRGTTLDGGAGAERRTARHSSNARPSHRRRREVRRRHDAGRERAVADARAVRAQILKLRVVAGTPARAVQIARADPEVDCGPRPVPALGTYGTRRGLCSRFWDSGLP